MVNLSGERLEGKDYAVEDRTSQSHGINASNLFLSTIFDRFKTSDVNSPRPLSLGTLGLGIDSYPASW